MTDKEPKVKQDSSEQPDAPKNESGQLIFFLLILAIAVAWGLQNPGPAMRILLVLLGFGGIVMIHELGHFIVAKLGGIKVEAFSIGFPPVLLGIRKLKKGWRVRLLPKIGEAENLQEGDNDTEYQIGLIPFGGFVRMLGQSDTGAAEAVDDPRSYTNRPVGVRIATVSAGVIFNAIGAIVIFIILFMNGIKLPPAVVGDVMENSPAYDAGIRPGDEIIEVNGESFVDFATVQLAPALSSPGEPIEYTVRHTDGTVETVQVVAETPAGDPSGLRYSGINQAQQLMIDKRIAEDPNAVEQLWSIGLRPGDQIKAVGSESVSSYGDFLKAVSNTFQPKVTLRVSRQWPLDEDNQPTTETVTLPVHIPPLVDNFRQEYDMTHFAGLVPALQVEGVEKPSKMHAFINWVRESILGKEEKPALTDQFQVGDILVKAADVDYPNYKQLREITIAHKDKPLALTVLRQDKQGQPVTKEVTVTPTAGPGSGGRVTIGLGLGLVIDQPMVADVLNTSAVPTETPAIPSGATITAIAGQSVETYFDIASILQKQEHAGQAVEVEYEHEGRTAAATVTVPAHEPIHAQASLAVSLPLAEYTRQFKASNPAEAVRMGFKKVGQFIAQNYVTLMQLIKGDLPASSLMGPVGIVSVSYQAAGYSLDRYLYFLGLISTCLAVMNLLPLPVLDGGHIVLLTIEKITGKPIHEKVLAPIMYAGLALLLGLILWVSYNDVVRILFG